MSSQNEFMCDQVSYKPFHEATDSMFTGGQEGVGRRTMVHFTRCASTVN